MLRFKPEVRIGVFTDALDTMLFMAAEWSSIHRVDVVINSVSDDAPGRVKNSLHHFDLALDCEPLGNSIADRAALADYFRVMLPSGYDVVFEADHVHVECDAHRAPLPGMPN